MCLKIHYFVSPYTLTPCIRVLERPRPNQELLVKCSVSPCNLGCKFPELNKVKATRKVVHVLKVRIIEGVANEGTVLTENVLNNF